MSDFRFADFAIPMTPAPVDPLPFGMRWMGRPAGLNDTHGESPAPELTGEPGRRPNRIALDGEGLRIALEADAEIAARERDEKAEADYLDEYER